MPPDPKGPKGPQHWVFRVSVYYPAAPNKPKEGPISYTVGPKVGVVYILIGLGIVILILGRYLVIWVLEPL